jgi:hypothetical protein
MLLGGLIRDWMPQIQKISIYKNLNGLALILNHLGTKPKDGIVHTKDP